ncbi:EAL domain-containing protein, partial [Komagataeibacter saccharivorans]
RSFIHNFEHDTNVQAVTMAVIGIGRRLGMTVVGEGVETAEQRALLEELDCDVMQGYLFARPLTPRKMEQWVRDGGGPAAIRATGAASGPHTSATS